MNIEWRDCTTDPPPVGEPVLCLFLYRFVNADWQWATPSVHAMEADGRWRNCIDPTLWAHIEKPEIPWCEARQRAAEAGIREAALRAERDALEAKFSAEHTRQMAPPPPSLNWNEYIGPDGRVYVRFSP